MDTRIWLCLVVALLSLAACPPAEACSCLVKHLQRSFCNSPVVFTAKFLSANSTDMVNDFLFDYSLIEYEFDIRQVFKGGDALNNLQSIYTSTEYYCDYQINPSDFHKEFLITGSIWGGRVQMMHCDYIKPWSQVSESQIKGLHGAYTDDCSCEIISCQYGPCSDHSSEECTFDDNAPQWDNMVEGNQMCARNEEGICVWRSISL